MYLANLIRNLIYFVPLSPLYNNVPKEECMSNQMDVSIQRLGERCGLNILMWKSPAHKRWHNE